MRLQILAVVVLAAVATSVSLADNLIVGSGPTEPGRFTFDRLADNGSLVLSGSLDVGRASHTAVKLNSTACFSRVVLKTQLP